ncbi:MAG: M23 family metallopeptidase, partial [Treponema sp.]|nr:M23 family metallopeptidase [Treponema sp.]
MASVHEYKRLENSIVQRVKNAASAVASGVGGIFKALVRFMTRRYTVVFVPHSEKKVYNLHITVLSVCCFLLVVAGVIGTFFWYGASYSSTRNVLATKDGRLKDVQASLDQLRDETAQLLRDARGFETALSGTLSAIGTDFQERNAAPSASGDLSSFFDIRETPDGVLQEVSDVRNLSAYLASAEGPIREIGTLLNSQSALLTEIPSIWPIKGGIGHISMFFGQNENPFSGQYYIHKGIDLSTYRQGDAIVATADGQVVTIDNDAEGFGNYVIIKHKHGYYTRYAHMLSFRVNIGQRVQQGETIGYIGNTGLSTGPHVHYEVHIGSDVVDPYKYINIRSSIA